MSTRCQIGLFDTLPSHKVMIESLSKGRQSLAVATIYKHSDGYPSNVLPLLARLLSDNGRKGDPCYCAAWLLHDMIEEHIQSNISWQRKMAKSVPGKPITNGRDFLGHGIDNTYHGDIQYFYAIANDKVVCYHNGDKGWQVCKEKVQQ